MGRFAIVYDRQAIEELAGLRKFDQVRIVEAIERHLADQPTRLSGRSIKRLEPPVLADYRLRVGEYRVFYNVDSPAMRVHVIAVRFKGRLTLEEAASGQDH